MLEPHLLAWLAVTLSHVALSHRWVVALRGRDATRDDVWFDTALSATGSLAAAVHVAAATGGLDVGSGAAALALWHAGCGAARHVAGGARPATAAPARDGATAAMELVAIVLLGGVALGWIGSALAAPIVTGADAAHYHVPVAVNLALGASPFDLPATQHLYPMTMSSLIAWFILPTSDLVIVDLAMLLPFALLAASAALLFRLVTGESGLAWTTGPVLAAFATPMFRASALPSADLLFAAAFTASLAVLLRAWSRGGAGAWDVTLGGLALGLLVGSKATGIPSVALLLVAWATLVAVTRRTSAFGPPAAWPVGLVLAVLAGGIWLARNWLLFGSPLAPNGLALFGIQIFPGEPFSPTTYLSLLGDATADPDYGIVERAQVHATRWFGVAFLPWLAIWILILPDALAAWRAPAGATLARVRLAAMWLVVATGGPLLWLLAGAPWTSLEWTNGYALRYALPLAVVLPVLSLAACLPARWPWHRHPLARAGALVALTVAGVTLLVRAQASGGDSPRLTALALAGALAFTVVARVQAAARAHRPMTVLAALLLATAGAAALTPFVAERREAFAGQPVAAPVNPATRAVWDAVSASETTDGTPCTRRRFFVITRFDEPLGLQSFGRPDAQVFYAAREVDTARRFGPVGPCDYVVTTPAVQGTLKGGQLVAALTGALRPRLVAETGVFVVVAPR